MEKEKANRVIKNTITLIIIPVGNEEDINKEKAEAMTEKVMVIKTETVKKIIKINYSPYSLNSFLKGLVKYINIIIDIIYNNCSNITINGNVIIKSITVIKKVIQTS